MMIKSGKRKMHQNYFVRSENMFRIHSLQGKRCRFQRQSSAFAIYDVISSICTNFINSSILQDKEKFDLLFIIIHVKLLGKLR